MRPPINAQKVAAVVPISKDKQELEVGRAAAALTEIGRTMNRPRLLLGPFPTA